MLSPRKNICLALLLCTVVGCNGQINSGDRVLVFKPAYDAGIGEPRRFEVVVFKFPPRPVESGVPKNYIKRLLGLPGELLAIFFGQIFMYHPDPDEARAFEESDTDPTKQNNLWRWHHMHVDSKAGLTLFDMPGKFDIVRKPPDVMMAMRRIVNDNDFQPSDDLISFQRAGKELFISKRWVPSQQSEWTPDAGKGFIHSGSGNSVDWLRYRHITRPVLGENADFSKPALITDDMDYNSPIRTDGDQVPDVDWVGDLMLECQLTVAKPEGEFRMELSRGPYRFQARFDLTNGQCSLFKMLKGGKEEALGKPVATRVKGPGEYSLRLANFDARLTLWVDDDLPFGDGQEYPPPEILAKGESLTTHDHAGTITEAELLERRGPTKENDLEPASLGSQGADLKIHHLRLWRDTYYSRSPMKRDFEIRAAEMSRAAFWRNPDEWGSLRKIQPLVMYVQPGHFLCLGDNSPMSSDSRAGQDDWGLVPQRLLLGRALMVYFPLSRAGPIR